MSEQMREKLYAAWKEAGWDDEYFAIGESMWNAAIAALSQPAAADETLKALRLLTQHIKNPFSVQMTLSDLVKAGEQAIAKATP